MDLTQREIRLSSCDSTSHSKSVDSGFSVSTTRLIVREKGVINTQGSADSGYVETRVRAYTKAISANLA